ncbi:MAG: DUF6064 family protein [Burkholderiales bacterium]
MTLPFTVEQFFAVFRTYNDAVWPMQGVLHGLGLGAVALAFFPRTPAADRVVVGILVALWAWMGIAYHMLFFSGITPAAWLFGTLFLVQAALLGWVGLANLQLRFGWPGPLRGAIATVLVVYALLIYPALNVWLGHGLMGGPTFGLPCPTTIFTIGMLGMVVAPFPRLVWVIPILWSGIGGSAAWLLAVPQDLGLIAAGMVALGFCVAGRPES